MLQGVKRLQIVCVPEKAKKPRTGRAPKKWNVLGRRGLLPVPLYPSPPSCLPRRLPCEDVISSLPLCLLGGVANRRHKWETGEGGQGGEVFIPSSPFLQGFFRLTASLHQMPPLLYDTLLPGPGNQFPLVPWCTEVSTALLTPALGTCSISPGFPSHPTSTHLYTQPPCR